MPAPPARAVRPSPRRRLDFPPQLSKLERAKWHSSANRKGLPTESRGVGDARFLSIGSQQAPAAAEEVGAGLGGSACA